MGQRLSILSRLNSVADCIGDARFPCWRRLVAQLSEFARRKNRCRKQNDVLPLLVHESLPQLDFGMRVEERARVYYESVIRKLAMADGGRFPEARAVIYGLLRPVTVAVVLIGIANFRPAK